MAQRQGTSWFRTGGLVAACFLGSLLIGENVVSGSEIEEEEELDAEDDAQPYKGSETLELVSVAPNVARCGNAPNVEAVFEGSGIDTAGGVFTVVSSGCQNPSTGLVFDLVATDTYFSGDSVNIKADPFFLVFDPQICVASNVDPVRYKIKGGTGAFAGAKGGGRFHFASNDPSCSGQPSPAFVWFKGKIR